MAITKDSGRQNTKVAYIPFTYATLASGVNEAVDIPAGAIVTGGCLVITTIFNSGTTDLLEVGDGVQDDDYLVAGAADNGSTAQYIAFTPTGYQYTANDSIDIKWTPVGTAATAGAGYMIVEYIVPGRAESIFDK